VAHGRARRARRIARSLTTVRTGCVRRGPPLSVIGFEALGAAFHPSKHGALDERRARSLTGDQQEEVEPPFSTVDLDAGRARIVMAVSR
jgi:hypothetical protein